MDQSKKKAVTVGFLVGAWSPFSTSSTEKSGGLSPVVTYDNTVLAAIAPTPSKPPLREIAVIIWIAIALCRPRWLTARATASSATSSSAWSSPLR